MPGIEVELREITEHLRQRGKFTSNSPFRFSYIDSVTIYLNKLQKNVLHLELGFSFRIQSDNFSVENKVTIERMLAPPRRRRSAC